MSFTKQQKAILLVSVAAIFLGVGFYFTPKKKPAVSSPQIVSRLPLSLKISPTPLSLPASLSLVPATATLKKGERLTISLRLNSGGYSLDATDVILSFDPKVFRVETVTPGKIFAQYPVKKIDNKVGLIQLSGAGEIKDGALSTFQGEEEYSQIVFTALSATSSSEISFGPKTILASKGKNVFEETKSFEGTYAVK